MANNFYGLEIQNVVGFLCFIQSEFEILSEEEYEENEEIDINNLEELNFYTVLSLVDGKFEENVDAEFKKQNVQLNKILKALKQLNKKMEE